MRRGRRRGATPATFPAAALGKTRRSSAISRLQGLVRGGVWPGMITETCVIHPRLLLGAGRAGAAVSTAEAARRSRSSPELGAWAPRVRQGLRDLAHRGQGARAVLTVGSWWPELRRREVVVVDRRRNRGVARGRGRGRGLRAPERCGSTRRAPTKPVEWSA